MVTRLVTAERLGEGDGVKRAFRIPAYGHARVSAVYRDDWQGRQMLYATPRTQLLYRTEDFSSASWSKAAVTATQTAIHVRGFGPAYWAIQRTATASSGLSQTGKPLPGAGKTTVLRAWLRADTADQIELGLQNAASGNGVACTVRILSGPGQVAAGNYLFAPRVLGLSATQDTCIEVSRIQPATDSGFLGLYIYPGDTFGAAGASVLLAAPNLFNGTPAGAYVAATTSYVSTTDYSLNGGDGDLTVSLESALARGATLTWSGLTSYLAAANLLPANASPTMRALADTADRISRVETPLRDLWNPATCPENLLPWLAWALSLDNWRSDWPVGIKRVRVAKAIEIQRHKGTAKSIRDVIASFGGAVELKEWWEQTPKGTPHTFQMTLALSGQDGEPASAQYVDDVIAEVDRTKPARSHYDFTQVTALAGAIGVAAYVRPCVYVRLALQAGIVDGFEELNLLAPALDPRITFTRSSPKTYFNAAGSLLLAAANECPLEYDSATLQPIGRTFWNAATNLSTASEFKAGLSDAPLRSGQVTAAALPSALGWFTTGIHVPGDTGTMQYVYKVAALAAQTTYTFSAFIVMDDGGAPAVGGSGNPTVDMYLQVGQLTATTGPISVTALRNGVYRVSAAFALGDNPSTNYGVVKGPTQRQRGFTVTGYQLETSPAGKPLASPYIPNDTASPAPRAADVGKVADLASLRFNERAGAMYLEWTPYTVGSSNTVRPLGLKAGNSNNRLLIYQNESAGGQFIAVSNSTTTASIGDGTPSFTSGTKAKAFAAWSQDDFSFVVNGRLVGHDASGTVPTGLAVMGVGHDPALGPEVACNGAIQRIRVYPSRISDDDGMDMTR